MEFRVSFETSCTAARDLPSDGIPEAALIGRSNVGKSSLLNALAGQHQLARTSRTPGRTQLLNLFLVNGGRLRLVDCPGYGYARATRTARVHWGKLVDQYLAERENLRLVLLLVDGRLSPQALDTEMASWLRARRRTVQVVATKWDRLSGNERAAARRRLEEALGGEVLPFSAVSGDGRQHLRLGLAKLS